MNNQIIGFLKVQLNQFSLILRQLWNSACSKIFFFNDGVKKAQVSIETILAVSILLGFFIIALGILGLVNLSSHDLQTQAKEWGECKRLAGLVEEVFVQGSGTQIRTQSAQAIQFSAQALYVGNSSCVFTAKIAPVSLNAGTILIWDKNGVVVLENE